MKQLVRIATSIPKQEFTVQAKIDWLDHAVANTPCDLLLLPQEYFGGGSMREICQRNGVATDDVPVTEEWLAAVVGGLAIVHGKHIGIGATVQRGDRRTEDFLYYNPSGQLLGYHSKIALPVQDNAALGGASGVLPEDDIGRAATPVVIPDLGLRVGTVFCWQVFFQNFWAEMSKAGTNLVVHPIKFAPRAWYLKGVNPAGEATRVGFTQEPSSKDPATDPLGWIRKLKFESEFKEFPIAVTCNTWNGGAQYLAMCGWVDEVTQHSDLHHVPSTPDAEKIAVTTFDPSLYGRLDKLSLADYPDFKDDWTTLQQGKMRRKAIRIEERTCEGKTHTQVEKYEATPAVASKRNNETFTFEE